MGNWFSRWWTQRITPYHEMNDVDKRRDATVLASISLGVLIISIIAAILSLPTYTMSELLRVTPVVVSIVAFIIPYHLARRGSIQAAAIVLVLIAWILNTWSTLSVSERYGDEIVYYYLAMTFFAYIYLSFRLFLIITIVSLMAVLLFGSLGSNLELTAIIRGPFVFLASMTAFTTFFVYVARLSEKEQRDQLRENERERAEQAIREKQYDVVALFIHAITHDFRTRLQGIGLSRDLIAMQLKRGASPEKIAERLNSIDDNIKSMSEELNKLVMMLKIDKSKPSLVYLDTIFAELERKLPSIATKKQVNLHLPQDKLNIPLLCDPTLLTTALEQLAHNAITFTPINGDVYMTVEAKDAEVIIEIRDTGIGIAEEHFEAVFASFFKVDDARSTEQAGLGLGLPIARTIIEMYDGTIQLNSAVNEGTTVTITLPRTTK